MASPEAGSRIWAPPVAGGVRMSGLPMNMRRPSGKGTIVSSVASKLGVLLVSCSVSGYTEMRVLQVVHIHIKEWDIFETAIDGILKVHLGSPVDTLVIFNQRGGASGGEQGGIAEGFSERISALDGMDVARCFAGSNDWVHAAFDEGTFAVEMIDSKGTRVFGDGRGGERDKHGSGREEHLGGDGDRWLVVVGR